MNGHNKLKQLALNLYYQGLSTNDISDKCGVSIRTIQRWIKDISPAPDENRISTKTLEIADIQALQDNDIDDTEATKQATLTRQTTDDTSDTTIDINITTNLAIRLLNLTSMAINTVAEILNDPEARNTDRLAAAKVVGDWTGLNDSGSILGHIFGKLELNRDDSSPGTLRPIPKHTERITQKIAIERKSQSRFLALEFLESRKLKAIPLDRTEFITFLQTAENTLDENEATMMLLDAIEQMDSLERELNFTQH